jgi:hypothetical protein
MFKILSSKGRRVLVVSDPHIRWQVLDLIIQKEKPDMVIVLGDFFDSHFEIGMGLREQREMAEWLKRQLNGYHLNPFEGDLCYEFHGIKGNHDLPYCYINHFLMCPGWTEHKDLEVRSVMNSNDWDKLNDFIILDDFLLTHAGLHTIFMPSGVTSIKDVKEWLPRQVEQAHKIRRENVPHWIFNQGYRMGQQNIGGIFWCHAGSVRSPYQEFQPRKGIKQIFGHTYQENGVKIFGDTDNFCIDTFLRNYIMVEDGQLSIKSL